MRLALRRALAIAFASLVVAALSPPEADAKPELTGCKGECKRAHKKCDAECLKADVACNQKCGCTKRRTCSDPQKDCLGVCSARMEGCFGACSSAQARCMNKC